MDEIPAFMTKAAFARLHGVAKPTVTGWARRGLLVLAADGRRVDVLASNARLGARPSVSRGGTAKVRPIVTDRPKAGSPEDPALSAQGIDPADWSRQEALRQREIAQAQLARIEADRAAGLVVPIADVTDAVRGEYHTVRTALLGLASKLAARLAAATTPEACGALVDTEVRAILTELTQDGAR
jgi:hypothetical protein